MIIDHLIGDVYQQSNYFGRGFVLSLSVEIGVVTVVAERRVFVLDTGRKVFTKDTDRRIFTNH